MFTNEVIPQYKILRGRFYKQGERNVAVIGYDFAYNIFDKPMSVGSNIYIAHEKYEVVGILEKVGNGGQPGSDRTIAISYEQARELAEGAGALGTNQISAIYVRVVEGFDPSLVGDQIAFKLRASHKVKENDFTMLTADYLKAQVETILGMITIFLGAVAGISLLVSAVGVSNTMFTAVVERTKEIGIMKSLGAKNSQILNMFLAESAGLCSVGGLIGLLVSIVFLLLFNFISNYFELGFEAVLTVWVIFFAFGFSLTIGIIAGVFPALQAANLNPVDALRR